MTTRLNLFDHVLNAQGPRVLATLVQVKGSSYRRPGARMLMDDDGIRAGVISAGCMESDLAARVSDVLVRGCPEVVKYDMGSELDRIWGTGMGCEGKADILLTPLTRGYDRTWAAEARSAQRERRAGVLLTVFSSPDPDKVGGTRWWDPSNQGAPLTPPLEEAARKALDSEKPVTVVLEGVSTLVEPVIPPVALWIYGAGENARPLANLAIQLGWEVGMLDHRPALAHPDRFPGARHVLSGSQEALAARISQDDRSAAVVMSHIFDPDKAMLRHLLSGTIPYVGLQGNRQRSAKLLNELTADGFDWTEERRARLHAPMGLDLGAESPEIIALAVLAEIQAVLGGRKPLSLRERKGSIHA